MKKYLQMFALVALMAIPWATQAQNTLTLCDGTATHNFVPFYGYYADESQNGQMLYPADSLTAMVGMEITEMVFYVSSWGDYGSDIGNWIVSLGTTTETSLSGINTTTALTEVYSGTMTFNSDNTLMTVTFANGFVYSGGNLLVQFNHPSGAGYRQIYFSGISATGAAYTYNASRDFLPKVTFSYGNPPTCIRPENMTATNVTSDGLTLNWVDAMNTGASYSIDYWEAGSDDTNTVTATTTSYTFTGLDANSLYYFAVKAVCSASDESMPLNGSFATACGGSTCDLTVRTWGEYSGSSYSPTVTLYQNGRELASVCSTTETVSVCSTDTVIVIYTDASYSWYTRNVSITDGGGTSLFDGPSTNYSTGDTMMRIATPCPTCIPPTALAVTSDSNEITFLWSPRSGASQFIVYLNDNIVNDNVSDTFYVFSGLTANTPYTVKVQSVCSFDDSSSIVSLSTRTACGQITLPYFVDFEDAAYNGAWYPCWDSTIHAGTDPSVNNVRNHTAGGQYGMYLQATSSQNYNLVVSPQIPTAGNNIYVRFWAYRNNGWIKAGVMTNPHDTATFIPMVNIESASGWNEYEFRTDTLDANATYYVAWLAYSTVSYSTTQIGEIDDIYISEAPSCARVPEVSIDTTTSDAITLSWADNGSNSYTVYYWVTGSTDTLNVMVFDTVATLNNLESLTGYSLYVVANCSGGDAEPSPVYTAATTCAASTCNLTAYVTDSYDDSWNGCGINIVQAGVVVGTIECPSGQSGSSFTYEVCSSAPVKFTFVRGNFPNELGGYIQDGGGNTVYTISSMGSYYTGDSLGYVAVPCPNCVPPADIYLSDTTASGVTIHWTAQAGQSAWIVRVDSTDINVTDTFYTVSTLAERTAHTVSVATDCSGDTSAFVTLPFVTGCAGGECELSVSSTNDYLSYGSYYSDYSPALRIEQNGSVLATVQSTTDEISVCAGMPVMIILENAGESWSNPTATVINGGDEVLFNSATSSYSTGDTLVSVANACPSCLKPTVQISTVDSNSLTFTWMVEGGASYLVSFDGGAYVANTTGIYTAYGLAPNTLHTFAVKAICSVGDTSNPRELSVKTACGEMAIPYTESFEGDAMGDVPSCWTVVSAGANGYPMVDDDGHTGSQSLTFVSNTNNTAMIAGSRIPLPGDSIKVSFWAYKDYGTGTLEAGMMTNPYVDSTFISLVTVTADTYTLYEFNTNTLSHDSTYYLAFRYAYNYDYYYAKVDDINITLDEGCMTPTNVTATPDSIYPNIDVAWSSTGSVTSFVVQYRISGSDTWSAPQTTSTTSKLLAGLSYSTAYEIRVGQVCGNDTLWAASLVTTTVCGLTPLPYLENFVSADGTLPPCWNYTAPTYFHWNRWTTHAEYSGDGEMMVGSGSAGEAAILPTFYAPIVKLEISFDAKLGNVSEGDGIMMGAYNESTGTVEWLDTLTNPGQSRENFVRFTYNYLNYSGSGTRIAVGHSHNNSGDWGFAMDSIVVIELATCNPPENVTAHNTKYPNTADDVFFTWTVSGSGTEIPSQWQLYIDTITSTDIIDSVPESQLITVDTNYYMPPVNMLAEGAHYRFFVRSVCGPASHSNWVELQGGFATDEFWMRDTVPADTIIGCDFIIYDNGGPVAGYMHNSNSTLVIQAGEAGRELQLQGGFFSHGADANSFTVYDGIGVGGTVLYSRNVTNVTETIDSVLATSTTGAMTITFTSGYYAALGYELYIHCVGDASCLRPTNLQVEMIGDGEALATWDSTGASLYRVYHHTSGDSVWNMNPTYTNSITLTGLPADVTYDFYVVGYCSATDTSAPSIIRHFSTHWEAPCEAVSNVQASSVQQNTATLTWTSTGTQWQVALVGGSTATATTNSYTFTGLTANTEYKAVVRNVCDASTGRYSEWSDTVTFVTLPVTYTITVASNNDAWGTVTGGGTYTEGDTVELVATPNEGYRFVSWQDGNSHATRTITVVGDATYTATFAAQNGIDDVQSANVTLFPNPASAAVTIRGLEGECVVTVVDLNGREVYKANANNTLTIDLTGYAKGAYFVRIMGERTTAIRKLVVK